MKILFLAYNFPGPLGPMASWLAARGHEVLFASTRSEPDVLMPGVSRIMLKRSASRQQEKSGEESWLALAARMEKNARTTLASLRKSGFEPEITIAASSNGSALALKDVFPGSFSINFLEADLSACPAMRGRICVQALQVMEAELVFAFSRRQKSIFHPPLQPLISPVAEMVDTDYFSPPENPEKRLQSKQVILASQGCGPELLEHLIAQCARFLAACPEMEAVLMAGNSHLERRLAEIALPGNVGARLKVVGRTRLEQRKGLFQSGRLAVFMSRGLEMLEAMSCGCPSLLCGDGGAAEPEGSVPLGEIAARLCFCLDHPQKLSEASSRARKTALLNHNVSSIMPVWFSDVLEQFGRWKSRKLAAPACRART